MIPSYFTGAYKEDAIALLRSMDAIDTNTITCDSDPIHVLSSFFIGTKVEDAKALMGASDLKIIACDNLDEAAKMVNIYNYELKMYQS